MSAQKKTGKIFTTDPMAAIKALDDKLDSCMTSFETRMAAASTTDTTLEQLAADFKQFKTCMKLAVDLIRSQMSQVTAVVDEAENRSRRKFLLFRGIEQKEGEILKDIIAGIITDRLNINAFTAEGIRFCYRLGKDSTRGESRPVLVRFQSMDIRSSIWRKKTAMKGSGVTIAEYLTVARKAIFNEGRRLYGVSKCWSQDGSVYLLTSDGTKHRIVSQAQLAEITTKFPPTTARATPAAAAGKSTDLKPKISTARPPPPSAARCEKTGRYVKPSK